MMLSNENDIINNDRSYNLPALVILMQFFPFDACRAVTKALIGGGGGAYSYIRVLPDKFLLKSTVMTTDFKRNSWGRTRIYEYPAPPPPN